MIDRLTAMIETIITREGGFVDRAQDRGGPTNWGITIGTLGEYLGRPVTVAEVQALPRAKAAEIYRIRYILGPGYDGIEAYPLLDLVVDGAVNNGRGRSTQWLQQAAGVKLDGSVGPTTLASVNSEPRKIFKEICVLRLLAYGELISTNHSQAIFAAGWLARIGSFIRKIG